MQEKRQTPILNPRKYCFLRRRQSPLAYLNDQSFYERHKFGFHVAFIILTAGILGVIDLLRYFYLKHKTNKSIVEMKGFKVSLTEVKTENPVQQKQDLKKPSASNGHEAQPAKKSFIESDHSSLPTPTPTNKK